MHPMDIQNKRPVSRLESFRAQRESVRPGEEAQNHAKVAIAMEEHNVLEFLPVLTDMHIDLIIFS